MLSIFDSIKNFVQVIQKIKLDNGIVLKLNKISSTAKIMNSPEARGDIIIPNSIIYKSKEYFIDSVDSDAFKNPLSLFVQNIKKSVDFSQNSQIKMITSDCFDVSIQCITFPPSLEQFKFTPEFISLKNELIFPPNSNCIKYLDSSHELLVSNYKENNINSGILTFTKKDDENNFDNLLYASQQCMNATIPRKIKYLDDFCFSRCLIFFSLKFEEPSDVISFGESSLPPIKELTIPSRVETLKPGWCRHSTFLKKVFVSPENKHFKNCESNSKLIIGRSNSSENVFDRLVFACRDIESVVIPSFIKIIDPFAFESCSLLKKVDFESNSNLNAIQKYSFSHVNIQSIKIPQNVRVIQENAFSYCEKLKSVEFDENSLLESLDENAFERIQVKCLVFPSKLEKFNENSVQSCKNLKCLEFLSKKIVINLNANNRNDIILISCPNVQDIQINLESLMMFYQNLIITTGNQLHIRKDM